MSDSPVVNFRLYAELNDLPAVKSKGGREIIYSIKGKTSVKDAIESLGIPHTEVDLILVNGTPVTFAYHLHPGDRISVYPVFESLDIGRVNRLRPAPLREPKFILDVHLGKLARWLRIAGFDTLYRNDYHDDEIIQTALKECRIILTRDLGILKNGKVTHGYFIRETRPESQFSEVIRRFQLASSLAPFSRCVVCNTPLTKVSKKEVSHLLQPLTRKFYDEFRKCPSCGKIYWKGSHYNRMHQRMMKILER